jgi:hypothetical protein
MSANKVGASPGPAIVLGFFYIRRKRINSIQYEEGRASENVADPCATCKALINLYGGHDNILS